MNCYTESSGEKKYLASTYLTFELKKAFREKCKQNGTTISTVLRQHAIKYLNDN